MDEVVPDFVKAFGEAPFEEGLRDKD